MPKKTTYTGEDLKRDKKKLRLTWKQFADELGFKGDRIMYMYAKGQYPIPKFIARSIRALLTTITFLPGRPKPEKRPGRPMIQNIHN